MLKKACASVSDPAVPSPRSSLPPANSPRPPTPNQLSRIERTSSGTKLRPSSPNVKRAASAVRGGPSDRRSRKTHKNTSSQSAGDAEANAWRTEMRRGAHALRDAKNHLADLHQKALAGNFSPEDIRAATARAAQLLREAERLQRNAAGLQPSSSRNPREEQECPRGYQPGDAYEPPLVHELRMIPPSSLLAPAPAPRAHPAPSGPGSLRSKSELELSRRLSESLDMQERLAADNADLDVKRYILYKELMVKEQRLETARAQTARLQNELKLLARDNARLQAAVNAQPSLDTAQNQEQPERDTGSGEPGENYAELEKQLTELEAEVQAVREMASTMHASGPCQPCSGGPNVCYEPQPGMPPMPPGQRDCGRCPPCPASCNPDAEMTPAERELFILREKLKKSEDLCKNKTGECILLRNELQKNREEWERERCVARETAARLRNLEMRLEGLAPQTSMKGPVEQAFETEVNVQNLKYSLRNAYDEIDHQRRLINEMDKQLQEYRVKYLQAQQLAEEQKRQIASLDSENVRIAEQVNAEIQRVKIKFQEKLQELVPLPRLLEGTHRKLQDAQQQQALAEHRCEQLARELMCARDKLETMKWQLNKQGGGITVPSGADRLAEEKLMAATQQRIVQLTEQNAQYKSEIDQLKASVARFEEQLRTFSARYNERLKENEALTEEKSIIRKEAERAIQRANERTVTVRKCMQTTIAELERQLAVSRAMVSTADKEREEMRQNMESQLARLQDNCLMAQRRVRGLSAQIEALHKVAPLAAPAPDTQQPCVCKGFLEDTKVNAV